MKKTAQRLAIIAALLVVASVVIDELADATQTRPDQRHTDRRTEVVIDLEGQHYRQHLATGATALFGACSATVSGALVDPGIVDEGNGRFSFSLAPSLGHHGKERLLGCLQDLTVERLRADVVSVTDRPLADSRA
jgi:hypothetical protein